MKEVFCNRVGSGIPSVLLLACFQGGPERTTLYQLWQKEKQEKKSVPAAVLANDCKYRLQEP